ncbi:PH domain-containing protein [Acrasis kona]|uniref:PH domain-containing protein n=1 Tax=Acrasis kona TaxID=1008807 RepID=A0AAW2Z9G1_9EUKA
MEPDQLLKVPGWPILFLRLRRPIENKRFGSSIVVMLSRRTSVNIRAPNPKDEHHEMSGQLQKMGAINKSWKERWFVLSDKKLFYYKNQRATSMKSFINLENAYVRTAEEYSPTSNCFDIVTPERVFQLVAPNPTVLKEWMVSIQSYSTIVPENDTIRKIDDGIIQKAKIKNEEDLETPEEEERRRLSLDNNEEYTQDEDDPTYNDFDLICNSIQTPRAAKKDFNYDSESFNRIQRMSVYVNRAIVQ